MTSDPNRMWDLVWGLFGVIGIVLAIAWVGWRVTQRHLTRRRIEPPGEDAQPVIEAKLLPAGEPAAQRGCVGCGVKQSPVWHFEETIRTSYGPLSWRKRMRANPSNARVPIKIDNDDEMRKRGLAVNEDTYRSVCPSCHVLRNYEIDQRIEQNYLKRLELEQQLALGDQQFLEGLNESLRRKVQDARAQARKR